MPVVEVVDDSCAGTPFDNESRFVAVGLSPATKSFSVRVNDATTHP
jgi:hypothetical protein